MVKSTAAAKMPPIGISFEPDILNGHQYFKIFRAQAHFTPEQRLMFAVLTDAVECFQKNMDAKSRAGRSLFIDAEKWLFSRDTSWPFSFEHICEMFDLNPTYIRRGLARWRETREPCSGPRKRIRESLRYQNRVKHNRLYVPEKRRGLTITM